MMPFSDNLSELRGLLDALCEETITAEQMRRLEEILLQHPEAEAYYVQYLSQYADLARHFTAAAQTHSPAVAGKAGETPALRKRRRRSTWLLAGALALTGLAAALLMAWLPKHNKNPHPSVTTEAVDNSVAVLLQSHDAVWDPSDLSTHPGAALSPGWLHLKSGVAHIEFYSGATVILQGPADFQLIGRNEAYCARGSLRATVPSQAQGFTIGSPKLDLVDRGTEFGLRVGADDKTEVHVFRGKVDFYDGSQRVAAAPKELTTGEGIRLDGPGKVSMIPTDPAAFETAEGLASRATVLLRRRQQEWQKSCDEWRRDPTLKVFYTFRQQEESWNRMLPDLAPGRHPTQDGAIVGCTWTAGRWPGKEALDFKRVSNRVRLNIPGEFDSLTLATWVRIDSLPNLNNSLMMSDGWSEGGPHWQIGDDGKLILGVQSSPKGKGAHYHAEGAITPKLFGQWLHLAVVYDRDAGKVTHYLDGQAVAEVPIEFDIPLHIGDAELGNWNIATHRNNCPIRFLNGCMDEFMVFSRALDTEEITRLYEQGRPPG